MHSCCKFLQCNYKRLHQQDQMNKILYLAVSRACIINCCISIDRVSIYYCRRVLSRLSEDDAKGETAGSCHPLTSYSHQVWGPIHLCVPYYSTSYLKHNTIYLVLLHVVCV